MTETRSKWYQTSSSTCIESQKPSGNIFICVHHILRDANSSDLRPLPYRLTGSLALSVAYGIQADTPNNEFFRLYEDMLEGVNEASVPGTFLVDVIPARESNQIAGRRKKTNDGFPQSSICLRGSLVYGSTRVQTK